MLGGGRPVQLLGGGRPEQVFGVDRPNSQTEELSV